MEIMQGRERRIEPQIRQSIASLYGNENHATDRTHLHPLRLPVSPDGLGRLEEVLDLRDAGLGIMRVSDIWRDKKMYK